MSIYQRLSLTKRGSGDWRKNTKSSPSSLLTLRSKSSEARPSQAPPNHRLHRTGAGSIALLVFCSNTRFLRRPAPAGEPDRSASIAPPKRRSKELVFMSGHRQQLHIEDIGDVTVVDFADKKILD